MRFVHALQGSIRALITTARMDIGAANCTSAKRFRLL